MFSCKTGGTGGERRNPQKNPKKHRKTQGNPLDAGLEGGWKGRMLIRIPVRILVLAWFLDFADKITGTAVRIRKIDDGKMGKRRESRKDGEDQCA